MNENVVSQAVMTKYAAYLRSEEKAESTIKNYLRDTLNFRQWANERPITKDLTAQWRSGLLAQNYAPATVNAKIAAVNSLLQFMGLAECHVKAVNIQRCAFRDESRDLTKDEYLKLLETAQNAGCERLELLMEAVCATGVRVSEVHYITVEAARMQRADIALKGKIRSILLPQKLCRKLLKYAKRQNITSGAVFRTRSGKPVSRGQIWAEMKSLCKKAGVAASKVFPHNLRHLFAVVYYKVHRDIVKLADLLGHSSINTTRIYLVTTGAEHARCLERLGLVS